MESTAAEIYQVAICQFASLSGKNLLSVLIIAGSKFVKDELHVRQRAGQVGMHEVKTAH
jgi:hypothetical protein